jgi:hypothetical protein
MGVGKVARLAHVLPDDVQAEDEPVSGEQPVPPAPCRVDEVVALPEVANPPQVGVVQMALEHGLRVGRAEVAVRHDSMREACRVRLFLEPASLLDRVLDPDRRLHVDCLRDVLEACLRDELRSHVPEHLEPVDIAENRVHPVGLEPHVLQIRILEIPVVDVRIDEGWSGHGAPPRAQRPVAGIES